MAITHIQYNPGTAGGSRIRQINSNLENAQTLLTQELATIVTLCEGSDPSSVNNFTSTILGYYGYSTAADAKASYDELASLNSKVNSDASVSSVMAAIKQCANKHR